MIKMESVYKQFPGSDHPVVEDLNMDINEGEVCVLVGASGCGKTTTMRMINRMLEPTDGNIIVDGKNIRDLNPIKLRLSIGYVIQEIGLFPHMSIESNIATVPMELKWEKKKIAERVREMMEMVELDPDFYAKKKPVALSGGQRQRVGVARAMAADPKILLMDEPFGALDPITRSSLQTEFLNIQKKMKKTIVFITHDMEEAVKMGDKIGVMQFGKLVQYGTAVEVLKNPANDFVENLVGFNRMIKCLALLNFRNVSNNSVILSVDDTKAVLECIKNPGTTKYIGLVNSEGNPVGYIPTEPKNGKPATTRQEIENSMAPLTRCVEEDHDLYSVLSEMFLWNDKVLFVKKGDVITGLITFDDLFDAAHKYGEVVAGGE